MWMGGYPPLGYEVKHRKLQVLPDEAEAVRHIFARYVRLKSVSALSAELKASCIPSKVHQHSNGEIGGGTEFSRRALFHLLRNRIYIGEIAPKKQSYPGQHEPIIDLSVFERVQQQFADNRVRSSERRFETSPLTRRVFDASRKRMTPAHEYGKQAARYRYYVPSEGGADGLGADYVSRVSAVVLEELVLDRMRPMLGKPP